MPFLLFGRAGRGAAFALIASLLGLGAAAPAIADGAARSGAEEAADPLERAAELTREDEWAAVIAILEPIYRAEPDETEAGLLLGIAYFRQGEHARAAPIFEKLSDDPDEEVGETARLFLGLIAQERGDAHRARRYFQDVATGSSGALSASAERLLAGPAAGQRVAGVLALRSLADSNVPLVSTRDVGPDPSRADVSLATSAAVVAWPLRGVDLRAVAAGQYRKQAQLGAFDFLAGRLGLHYRRSFSPFEVELGYAFEGAGLGGELLQTGHHAEVSGALLTRHFAEVTYEARARAYAREGYEGYSGHSHRSIASAGRRFRGGEVALGAVGQVDRTRDASLAGPGAGARARLRLSRGDVTARAEGELLRRWLGGRDDIRAEARVALSYALHEHFALLAETSALSNRSSAEEFDHVKFEGGAGAELRY